MTARIRLALIVAAGLGTGCGAAAREGALVRSEAALQTTCSDADGDRAYVCPDGVPSPTAHLDCDDTSAARHWAEDPGDGVDNDCDGQTDEPPAAVSAPERASEAPVPAGCTDADLDGWYACPPGTAGAPALLDCNDQDTEVTPSPHDDRAGDGKDNDCDGKVDERPERFEARDCRDDDQDGFSICAQRLEGERVDCDDRNPDVSPRAIEKVEDGVDNDCDGDTDEGR